MCGIAGVISKDIDDVSIIDSIVKSQYSRGPDFSRIEEVYNNEYYIYFGHNRLIINDLSSASNQPFWDSTRRYCLIFNGEIYNYKELSAELIESGVKIATSGDTEVLLLALIEWGREALNKLNGMFAFCFLDLNRKTALLARDRFGKKPLYYKFFNNKFIFSSTSSELALKTASKPNLHYIANGVKSWVYENGTDYSQYQGINTLPGGYSIQISIGDKNLKFDTVKYYDLKKIITEKEIYKDSYEIAKIQLIKLFDDAVKLRLRSDVPVAIALSGGLDSSSIAAIAKKYNSNIEAVTFGRPDHKKSEGPLVNKLAAYLDLKVNYVWPTIEQVRDAFDACIYHQDSPILSLSYIAEYLVYKRAHELGFKVMLGGQGGDEVFMGYRKYQILKFLDDINEKAYYSAFIQSINMVRILYNELFQVERYLKSLKRINRKSDLDTILNITIDDSIIEIANFKNLRAEFRQVYDVCEISVPVQVKSEDRNSMAHSIETRSPFLDYRLVEFGILLPQNFKIKNGYGKWILRDAIKGYIPDEIRLARYKRGYDMSNDWIKMGLGDHIREKLRENEHILNNFLRRRVKVDFFSDSYLINNVSGIQEVSTLLWLCKKYR